VVAGANYRVDAWVTPPAYTARPPLILPGLRAGEPIQTVAAQTVPAGSTLVIRATGTTRLDVAMTGGLTPAPTPAALPPAGTDERRFVIKDGGSASLRGVADDDITWTFTAIPDRPPTIALAKDPQAQVRGSLQLAYKLEDDYGVTEARAIFTRKSGDSAKQNKIEIKDFAFNPKTLTVKSGEKVTWINRDEEPHTVVSVEKQFKKSTALDTDQEFTITAGAPGTYTYFCSVHPKMTGTIIVEKS